MSSKGSYRLSFSPISSNACSKPSTSLSSEACTSRANATAEVEEHGNGRVVRRGKAIGTIAISPRGRDQNVPRMRVRVEHAGDVHLRRPRLAHSLEQHAAVDALLLEPCGVFDRKPLAIVHDEHALCD
eukprot:1601209-Prymnesium_polylepis.1